MKRSLAAMGLVICACAAQAMQKNGEVWHDTAGHVVNAHGGGVLAHGGKYYLYGEHKVYGRAGNKAHVGVHMYSSEDLESWKDEGAVLKVEDKVGSDIEDGCVLERPKILFCEKTGKFVMFFHLELKGQGYKAARVGIAVADKPALVASERGPVADERAGGGAHRGNEGEVPVRDHPVGRQGEPVGRAFRRRTDEPRHDPLQG